MWWFHSTCLRSSTEYWLQKPKFEPNQKCPIQPGLFKGTTPPKKTLLSRRDPLDWWEAKPWKNGTLPLAWDPMVLTTPDKNMSFSMTMAAKRDVQTSKITLLRVIPTMTFIHFVTGKSSGILSDIFSGIRSGISSGILPGISSGRCSGISSGRCSGISSGICSGISSGIPSGILSGISSGILSGKSSGIPSGILSSILLAYYLANLLAFYLANILALYLAYFLAF